MKSFFMFWACWFITGAFSPLLAGDGDFENRLRSAELAGDRQQVAAICKEWYASGKYSAGLLHWNYNALMSVEENALLFTQQESDTYPALLLQYALDVRPDVSIISFQLLENQQYRSALIQSEGLSWIPANCSMSEFLSQILASRAQGTQNAKSIYFGSMINKNLLESDKEKLYLTGLALKFSPQPFDNVAILRNNMENRFQTDYLDLNFEQESDPQTVARVNLNYIPALLLLHRHYSATGETEKADRMKGLALRIARAGERETEVKALFSPEKKAGSILSAFTPKVLEKGMKKVDNKLFASETETTNAQYEAFLTDLIKNKDYEQLDLCKTRKTDWVSLLPKELQELPADQLFRHGNPDDPQLPVQNISYEAAQHYCAWITQVYNASPEKKKYKKVLFRLPTEQEWMDAARGGIKEVAYPWGGYYVQNSKGCYLGNYNTTRPCGDCPDQKLPLFENIKTKKTDPPVDSTVSLASLALTSLYDGGFFAVPVDSYYPNRFGLYAMSGNVAEMVAEKGKTKGGSWQDAPYYGQITAVKVHNEPSPAVGFRVFMEVIEE